MAAAMMARYLLWTATLLQSLGTILARGGGRGRGLNRLGSRGEIGVGKKEQSLLTPEITVYILVIVVFFLLFICICMFKEPDPDDYLSKNEKQKPLREESEGEEEEEDYTFRKTQIL